MDKDYLFHEEGEEREDHKYIARVEINQPKQKYRYFYDKAEYNAYLASVGGANILGSGKTIADKLIENNQTDGIKENVEGFKKTGERIVDKLFEGPKDIIKNLVDKVIDKFDGDDEDSEESEDDYNIDADKFFDSEDEKEDYIERFEYQENEPDFMKDVPDIPEDEAYSKFEDQEKVNELYDPHNTETSENCANCSMAYELRRRGYDVEAKPVEDDYNGSVDRVYDYFEDAEQLGIRGDGSTIDADEKLTRALTGNGEDMTVAEAELFHKEAYDFWTTNYSYTPEVIEKGILANNPPGSRGFIDVSWTSGGAHSIVYEVDTKGKVTIRDSQTWDEYDLDELAHSVCSVRITRTDNLKLKENAKNAVKPNEDRERKYYVDQGYYWEYR